jgi:hypothetical protein
MRKREKLGVAAWVGRDRVVWQERGGVDKEAVVEVVGRERSGGGQVLARYVGCEARCGGGRVGWEGKEEESRNGGSVRDKQGGSRH